MSEGARMSKRSERRLKAGMRREEIAEELRQFLARVLDTTKGGAGYRWEEAIKEGEIWVRKRTILFPQEAHMYRMAARMLQRRILKAMKWKKVGIVRKPK